MELAIPNDQSGEPANNSATTLMRSLGPLKNEFADRPVGSLNYVVGTTMS
jgi:hypothetical protein